MRSQRLAQLLAEHVQYGHYDDWVEPATMELNRRRLPLELLKNIFKNRVRNYAKRNAPTTNSLISFSLEPNIPCGSVLRFCGAEWALIPGGDTVCGCCGVNVGTGTADADGASWKSTVPLSPWAFTGAASTLTLVAALMTTSSGVGAALTSSTSTFASPLCSEETSSSAFWI